MAFEYRRLQLSRFWHGLDIKLFVYTWMPLLHLLTALTSAVIAGVVGAYLHELIHQPRDDYNDVAIIAPFATRFVFIEIVAGLSILSSLFCMVPSPRVRNMWFCMSLPPSSTYFTYSTN